MSSKSESDKVGLTLCRVILMAAVVIRLDVSGLVPEGTVKSTLVILFLIASVFCLSLVLLSLQLITVAAPDPTMLIAPINESSFFI